MLDCPISPSGKVDNTFTCQLNLGIREASLHSRVTNNFDKKKEGGVVQLPLVRQRYGQFRAQNGLDLGAPCVKWPSTPLSKRCISRLVVSETDPNPFQTDLDRFEVTSVLNLVVTVEALNGQGVSLVLCVNPFQRCTAGQCVGA